MPAGDLEEVGAGAGRVETPTLTGTGSAAPPGLRGIVKECLAEKPGNGFWTEFALPLSGGPTNRSPPEEIASLPTSKALHSTAQGPGSAPWVRACSTPPGYVFSSTDSQG